MKEAAGKAPLEFWGKMEVRKKRGNKGRVKREGS